MKIVGVKTTPDSNLSTLTVEYEHGHDKVQFTVDCYIEKVDVEYEQPELIAFHGIHSYTCQKQTCKITLVGNTVVEKSHQNTEAIIPIDENSKLINLLNKLYPNE